MRIHALSGLALLAAASGCTFIVAPILADAEDNVVGDGNEGEGEGEEGEGEGEEGEGEGEGEGEDDPACEAEERLIVVRDEEVDVVRIYDLDNGGLVRRFPDGSGANVNLDNDDPNQNPYGGSHAVIGSNDRLYVVGDRFLYKLRASNLTQQSILGRTQLTLDGFGSFRSVEMINDVIITAGSNIQMLSESAAVGATSTVLHDDDDYLATTSFSIGTGRYVAVSAEYGYVVVAAFDGGPPQVIANLDVGNDTDRIHKFFGVPKGIAFDPTTQQLLLGDHGRVITLQAPNFIYDPEDDDGDFVLAGAEEVDVAAIAARGGFAWALLRRGTDNLVKLDLSQNPPVAVDLATLDTNSSGEHIAVGCRRLFVTSQDRLVAVDRDDLGAAGNLSIARIKRIRVVARTALGLDGDD